MLLKYGINVNSLDDKKQTALDLAVILNNKDMVVVVDEFIENENETKVAYLATSDFYLNRSVLVAEELRIYTFG